MCHHLHTYVTIPPPSPSPLPAPPLPLPRGPPMSPAIPVLTDLDSKSITVFWKEPYSHSLYPITNYVIQYYEGNSSQHVANLRTSGPVNTYTLSGISEETDFFLRVCAVSDIGKGPPSDWLVVRTLKGEQYDVWALAGCVCVRSSTRAALQDRVLASTCTLQSNAPNLILPSPLPLPPLPSPPTPTPSPTLPLFLSPSPSSTIPPPPQTSAEPIMEGATTPVWTRWTPSSVSVTPGICWTWMGRRV